MKNIIVTFDQKYGIGADNDLLWLRDLPADLKHFRSLTIDQAVIMGRKTYDSIGKPLPRRQTIVISRQHLEIEGATVVADVDAAFEAVEEERGAFVIGGGEIFTQAIASVDRLYVTEVRAVFPAATVFFPAIDAAVWKEVSREKRVADERNKYNFDFVVYDRR